MNNTTVKVLRGFAAMTPARRTEVSRLGGRKVSKNAEHMATIGRKGGITLSRRGSTYMAKLGRKGGSTPKTTNTTPNTNKETA